MKKNIIRIFGIWAASILLLIVLVPATSAHCGSGIKLPGILGRHIGPMPEQDGKGMLGPIPKGPVLEDEEEPADPELPEDPA